MMEWEPAIYTERGKTECVHNGGAECGMVESCRPKIVNVSGPALCDVRVDPLFWTYVQIMSQAQHEIIHAIGKKRGAYLRCSSPWKSPVRR
jgi:hypothetical protein